MKGVDVSEDQLRRAGIFYAFVVKDRAAEDPITMARADFLRMLAWYGAIKADGARKGAAKEPRTVARVREPEAGIGEK